MSTYTQYYSLDKYEDTDRPNLRDQYNAAMDKIDTQLHTQDTSIGSQATALATMQGTVASHTTQIADLRTDVNLALSEADRANGGVTTVRSQLNGSYFYYLPDSSRGTEWTAETWASSLCKFNAFIAYDEDSDHGLLIGNIIASSSSTTPATAHVRHAIVSLTNWTLDTSVSASASRSNGTWLSGGLSDSNTVCVMDGTSLSWEIVYDPGTTSSIGSGEAFASTFAFPVTRRSS